MAYDGPLTILVDRFSASASEIFAAAMQDYGRGLVIGQETYGKGSVQNLYPLDRYALGQDPGYGQLTVTIGMYYRVTGDSTQNRGVQPDLSLPSAISAEEVGESSRDGSLPWNRIRPADFRREGAYATLLPELQREHDARIATDPNFQFAVAEIAALEKMRSEKSVSLNLEERKAERESRTKEQLARENARRAALGPGTGSEGRDRNQGSRRAGRDPWGGRADHGRPDDRWNRASWRGRPSGRKPAADVAGNGLARRRHAASCRFFGVVLDYNTIEPYDRAHSGTGSQGLDSHDDATSRRRSDTVGSGGGCRCSPSRAPLPAAAAMARPRTRTPPRTRRRPSRSRPSR